MGFNNAKERRKFEKEWRVLEKQYREAKFSEEGIAAIRAFDVEVYRSERNYADHTQELPVEDFDEDAPKNASTLFARFESLTTTFDESDIEGRYAWVDTISDSELAARLRKLKASDLELLTLIVIDGYGQREIARIIGCRNNAIWKRITRITNFLKKI